MFNANGAALVSGTTLTTQASTPIRVVGPTGTISGSTTVTSDVLVPPVLLDVPEAADWRLLTLDSVSGVQQLRVRRVTVGVTVNSTPVVGTPVELALDASTTTAFAAAADANGNLAVAYQSNAGGTTQLFVAFFDAAGNLLEPPTFVGGAAANYAIASGSSVFGTLAAYSVQTGPDGSAGDAVAFEIRGFLFGPAAVVEAPPALALVPVGLDNNRELAIYNEQNANKLIGSLVFSGYSTGSIEDIAEGISGQSGASVTETDLDKLFASMRCSDNGGSDEPDTELPLPEMTEDAVPPDSELPQ